MSTAPNVILVFFLAISSSQFCHFKMREIVFTLLVLPVFAQPGTFFWPNRSSKFNRTSFAGKFPLPKPDLEKTFPGASPLSDSSSDIVNYQTAVFPTSTVSYNDGTTISNQFKDEQGELESEKEFLPFIGELIQVWFNPLKII